MENQKKVFFGQYYFGLFYESYWLTFYNFWIDEGVINNDFIKTWTDHLMKGIFNIIILENFVIITRCPKYIKRDDIDRLHSVETTSIYDQHYIHGIFFEKELWEKVTSRKIKVKDLLSMQNVDQRFVAMSHYGFENLIDNIDKKLIDKSKYGNELYSTMFNNIEVRFLIYPDIDFPDKKRISFVKPDLTSASDAMAWKHNCTEKEYYSAKILERWV